MRLLLQQMDANNPQEGYKDLAEWDPDSDEPVPDEFTGIYPAEVWEMREPEFFEARINGPYTFLIVEEDEQEGDVDE